MGRRKTSVSAVRKTVFRACNSVASGIHPSLLAVTTWGVEKPGSLQRVCNAPSELSLALALDMTVRHTGAQLTCQAVCWFKNTARYFGVGNIFKCDPLQSNFLKQCVSCTKQVAPLNSKSKPKARLEFPSQFLNIEFEIHCWYFEFHFLLVCVLCNCESFAHSLSTHRLRTGYMSLHHLSCPGWNTLTSPQVIYVCAMLSIKYAGM